MKRYYLVSQSKNTIGPFSSIEQAEKELQKVEDQGYVISFCPEAVSEGSERNYADYVNRQRGA